MSANNVSANNLCAPGLVAIVFSVAMLCGESTSRADNWPSWRGPEHNGISREKSPPIDWDECWRQYRLHAYGGYIMAFNASMRVERTARGDQMFMTMARRHATHVLDLRSHELLT